MTPHQDTIREPWSKERQNLAEFLWKYPEQRENVIDSAYLAGLESAKEQARAEVVEIVICAAIRMKDGYIIRGHRHNNCIETSQHIPRYKGEHAWGENQGFVTSKNRYVDRLEGARIQKAAGIKSKMPEGQEYLHGELYSEDLY